MIPWYLKKEVWGAVLTAVMTVLMIFEPGTVWYQIGVGLGALLTALGFQKVAVKSIKDKEISQ